VDAVLWATCHRSTRDGSFPGPADAGGRWLKRSPRPNPTGRPMAARQRISEKLLAYLAVVWEEHGKGLLERLAKDDPGKLATIAYGLLPKDVFISVEQKTPGNLEPEARAAQRRVLDLIQAAGAETLARCLRDDWGGSAVPLE
jgi:hypothetical protein